MKPIPISLSPTRSRALNVFLGASADPGLDSSFSRARDVSPLRSLDEHGYRAGDGQCGS